MTLRNKLNKNIKTLQKSEKAYRKKASGVKLDAKYKKKIRDGTLNTETIKDEKTLEKVKEYQKWYDAAEAVKDQIVDLKIELKELAKQKLDNIIDDFDKKISYRDALKNKRYAKIELKQLKGQKVTEKDYQYIGGKEKESYAYQQKKYNTLKKELEKEIKAGNIKKYSDAWYEYMQTLQDIETSMLEIEAELETLKKSIRELRWESFNKAIDKINNLKDELSDLASLFNDESFYGDNGEITTEGMAYAGVIGQQMAGSKKLAAEYAAAIKKLDAELKSGNITQEEYNEELAEYKSLQRQASLETKQHKDAILDLVKNGIKKETEAMQELIKKRKEKLALDKSTTDYNKELQKKLKERNKLQAKLDALEDDNSQKGILEKRKLNEQLRQMDEELADFKADREYNLMVDGYDKQLEEFEKKQEEQLHILETNLEAQNEAIANMLSLAQENYSDVYDELTTIADNYGMSLSKDVVDPWKNATAAVNAYNDAVAKAAKASAAASVSTSKINTSTSSSSSSSSSTSKSSSSTSKTSTSSSKSSSSSSSSKDTSIWKGIGKYSGSKSGLNYNSSIVDRCKYNGYDGSFAARKKLWSNLGNKSTYSGSASQNSSLISQLKKKGFASGGTVVADKSNYDEDMKKLISRTGEDGFALVRNGETILTPETASLLKDSIMGIPNLSAMTKIISSPSRVADSKPPINVHYDNMINVEGNMTKDVVPNIKQLTKDISKELARDFRKLGYK